MARKLTARFGDKVFTRTTDRTYTHVVLARWSLEYARAEAIKHAARAAEFNYDYYLREANPRTRKYDHALEELKRITLFASMTREEFREFCLHEKKAYIDQQVAKGQYERLGAIGWCGRPDLAQKLAAKTRNNPSYCDVIIVPVDS